MRAGSVDRHRPALPGRMTCSAPSVKKNTALVSGQKRYSDAAEDAGRM